MRRPEGGPTQEALNNSNNQPQLEQNLSYDLSIMILSPWVTYLIADGAKLSGIVAILTNGIFLNLYSAPNVNRVSRKVLKVAIETLAYSAETIVFLFLGMGIFSFQHQIGKEIGLMSIVVALLNFNLARFLNIMTVTFLVNKTRSDETKISGKTKFVMWVAGLRGAMAYALSMLSCEDYGEAGVIMLSFTLVYAIFTILVIGSSLNPILNKCDVKRKEDSN